jgi:thiol-disulfide isomerase/thioredoxin
MTSPFWRRSFAVSASFKWDQTMKPLAAILVQALVVVVAVAASCTGWAEPATGEASRPSVDDVLAAHRQNQERLESLHLQGSLIVEYTQDYRDANRQEADKLAGLLKQIESGEVKFEDFGPQLAVSGYTLESLKKTLQESMQASQAFSQNTSTRNQFEIFIQGRDYQVRTPVSGAAGEPGDWKFPTLPANAETLGKDYANVRIFTRSQALDPPARVWCGVSSSGSPRHVLIMNEHLSGAQHLNHPPFTPVMQPRWDYRHPIDEFFMAKPERYRVVREEVVDDRKLLVVDALVPHETTYSELDKDGAVKTVQAQHFFRAWLDMSRGAVPMKLKQWHGKEGLDFEQTAATQPALTITATEVRELASGGWYPAVTLREDYQTAAATDKKPAATYVTQRMTWKCSLVEAPANLPESFFVLDFPAGQPFFDWETKREVGALEPKSPVRVGEAAPPLDIARWLDGDGRTLDDLRGRVVVIDFWGLWCGACRSAIPSLKDVQERYRDKPVTFIALHTAEGETDALAGRVQEFADEQGWSWLHAIDSGTTTSNSATCHAYGVSGFPTEIIIGADGRIVFNSNVPPPGLEDIIGNTEDEATPEAIKRLEAYMHEQFDAAGIDYPADDLPQEEQAKRMNRFGTYMLSREIDKALKDVKEEGKE